MEHIRSERNIWWCSMMKTYHLESGCANLVHGCAGWEESVPSMMRMCHLGNLICHSLRGCTTSCTRYVILKLDSPSWCKGAPHTFLMSHGIPWWTTYDTRYTRMFKIVRGCSDAQGGWPKWHDAPFWWRVHHHDGGCSIIWCVISIPNETSWFIMLHHVYCHAHAK